MFPRSIRSAMFIDVWCDHTLAPEERHLNAMDIAPTELKTYFQRLSINIALLRSGRSSTCVETLAGRFALQSLQFLIFLESSTHANENRCRSSSVGAVLHNLESSAPTQQGP